MRDPLPDTLERFRITWGMLATDRGFGANGAFLVQCPKKIALKIVASNGILGTTDETKDWEHVSVSRQNRCPSWEQMCFVKDLFWMPEECVVQYHPPASDYVNNNIHVLHMWRHRTQEFLRPPSIMVGLKSLGEDIGKGQAIKAMLAQQGGG